MEYVFKKLTGTPTLSIITAVYNAGDKLRMTLESLLSQNYSDYELIIIDGLSSDNTLDIASFYANKFQSITICTGKDKGVYDAMNKGVEISNGIYIYFLNAGDVLYNSSSLLSISSNFDNQSVIYGNAYTFDNGKIVPYRCDSFNKYRLSITNICHQTIFYPAVHLKKTKYDLRYKLFADYNLNIHLWTECSFKYCNINVILYEGGGISARSRDLEFERVYKTLIVKKLGIDVFLYFCFISLLKKIRVFLAI